MARIKIDRTKCCECWLCETACSLQYSKSTVNPKRSRVRAFFKKPGVDIITCDHCEELPSPQCIKICLSNALTLGEE